MLDAIKRTIEPPYKLHDLYSIFVALFVMLLLPLTVYQVTNLRDDRSNAALFPSANSNESISVAISSLKSGQVASGKIDLTIESSTETSSIAYVGLYSGNLLLATITNPSNANNFTTKVTWDTTKEPNGQVALFATATDSNGSSNSSTKLSAVIANNDTTPPSISFSNLNDGDYLGGTSFPLKLLVSDDTGISLVEVSLDGQIVQRFDKVPYEFNLDIANLAPGNHTFKAFATDYLGNKTSQMIKVYRGVGVIKG
jgi:hypothetical protein